MIIQRLIVGGVRVQDFLIKEVYIKMASDKYKKVIMKKLTDELGNFSEATAYFAQNEDFEPTIDEKTASVEVDTCPTCGEKYAKISAYSCEACDKTFAPKIASKITDDKQHVCPTCNSPMEAVAVTKCACGIRRADSNQDNNAAKTEAAQKLAAYLGRHKSLNKQASKMVAEASKDDDTVAWGDCIVDQYAEGYSLGESLAICNCIKKEVIASIEEQENARKIRGVTKVAFDGSNFVDVEEVEDESAAIKMEVTFEFDPVTQQLSIVSTDIEDDDFEEDEFEAEEVSDELVEDEVIEDDLVEDEAVEVADELPVEEVTEDVMEDGTEFNEELEEVEETEFDVPEFEEDMIEGTNLDLSEEEKATMDECEIKEARISRIKSLLKRAHERKASLEVVKPKSEKALGSDTSSDPQAGNAKGEAPKMGDNSDTHKPEPKKEVQTLEGENSLQYQNDLVELNLPKIPTQRQLELQDTAVPQKERMLLEGEIQSEQMKANDPSYTLDKPEVPVSKTTPHDTEDYSQDELNRPKVPTQTDGGRLEKEFVAENENVRQVLAEQEKRIESLRSYAMKTKKASKIANEMVNIGLIESSQYDDKVEQLASMPDANLDGYLEDLASIQAKYISKNAEENKVTSTEVVAAASGATSVLAIPSEQAVELDSNFTDKISKIASTFSIGRGADAQTGTSMDEFIRIMEKK